MIEKISDRAEQHSAAVVSYSSTLIYIRDNEFQGRCPARNQFKNYAHDKSKTYTGQNLANCRNAPVVGYIEHYHSTYYKWHNKCKKTKKSEHYLTQKAAKSTQKPKVAQEKSNCHRYKDNCSYLTF